MKILVGILLAIIIGSLIYFFGWLQPELNDVKNKKNEAEEELVEANAKFDSIQVITELLIKDVDSIEKKAESYAVGEKEALGVGFTVVGNSLHCSIVPADFDPSDVALLNLGVTYLIAVGVEFDSDGYFIQDKDDNMERKALIIPNKID